MNPLLHRILMQQVSWAIWGGRLLFGLRRRDLRTQLQESGLHTFLRPHKIVIQQFSSAILGGGGDKGNRETQEQELELQISFKSHKIDMQQFSSAIWGGGGGGGCLMHEQVLESHEKLKSKEMDMQQFSSAIWGIGGDFLTLEQESTSQMCWYGQSLFVQQLILVYYFLGFDWAECKKVFLRLWFGNRLKSTKG